MKYIYNNAKGPKASGNCASRAISIVTGKPIKEIAKLLTLWQGESSSNGTAKNAVTELLTQLGYGQMKMEKINGKWPKVKDVKQKNCVVSSHNHYIAIKNGECHDTWDSTEKPAYSIWIKKNKENKFIMPPKYAVKAVFDTLPKELKSKCGVCNETLTHVYSLIAANTGLTINKVCTELEGITGVKKTTAKNAILTNSKEPKQKPDQIKIILTQGGKTKTKTLSLDCLPTDVLEKVIAIFEKG